ncbi:target of Nesh-SH3 isoform X3 [Silurus asotus]|uniref:Target of Nesh-SH3 isoform X3 n=1 Tax=Silurus asotus TaxID=30991 RepID=A0AAD5FMW2_SILAS|nr:target of Nesh-SH3 isoform X3 [Silurus asotus]
MSVFLLLLILSEVLLPNLTCASRVRRETTKVRISAIGDTITLKFLQPDIDTKLEGYILGYGRDLFSKQFMPLPEDGEPYETEIDAEPKYLVAVQPVKGDKVKKECAGNHNLKKPLHLVIGSVTPTSVMLSWGTLLNTLSTETNLDDCIDDGHYTVRYREKEPRKKWSYQTCPTTVTVIDKLKPETPYEFGVRAESENGVWSPPITHNTADRDINKPVVPENILKSMQKPITESPQASSPSVPVLYTVTQSRPAYLHGPPAPPPIPRVSQGPGRDDIRTSSPSEDSLFLTQTLTSTHTPMRNLTTTNIQTHHSTTSSLSVSPQQPFHTTRSQMPTNKTLFNTPNTKTNTTKTAVSSTVKAQLNLPPTKRTQIKNPTQPQPESSTRKYQYIQPSTSSHPIKPFTVQLRTTQFQQHTAKYPLKTAQPKPRSPKPYIIHPQVILNQSQPSTTRGQLKMTLEPITKKSDPHSTQTQSITTQPQPKPLITQPQPSTTQSQPNTSQPLPITIQTQPRMTKAENKQGTTKTQPTTMQFYSQTNQPKPIKTQNKKIQQTTVKPKLTTTQSKPPKKQQKPIKQPQPIKTQSNTGNYQPNYRSSQQPVTKQNPKFLTKPKLAHERKTLEELSTTEFQKQPVIYPTSSTIKHFNTSTRQNYRTKLTLMTKPTQPVQTPSEKPNTHYLPWREEKPVTKTSPVSKKAYYGKYWDKSHKGPKKPELNEIEKQTNQVDKDESDVPDMKPSPAPPIMDQKTPTTTPFLAINGSRYNIGDNSSIFSSVPVSEVDPMGKKRFIAPHVIYQVDKPPEKPCSVTNALSHFPEEENEVTNISGPPKTAPTNLTVVTVEGCPSFVIIDWDGTDNETTAYEVTSSVKSPNGQVVSVVTTNQTHTAVENLKPESSYEFTVTPKNELGSGPSSEPVSFNTESADPRVSKVPTGKNAIWSSFSFKADGYSECTGTQYVKRTWYRKFVGIQLCNSLRYKIYLSDSLKGKFYNIGDEAGYGEDHCQFVDSFLDGRTGGLLPPHQLPLKQGFFRAMRQEPVRFGKIGGSTQINYVAWYECGVPIPGSW